VTRGERPEVCIGGSTKTTSQSPCCCFWGVTRSLLKAPSPISSADSWELSQCGFDSSSVSVPSLPSLKPLCHPGSTRAHRPVTGSPHESRRARGRRPVPTLAHGISAPSTAPVGPSEMVGDATSRQGMHPDVQVARVDLSGRVSPRDLGVWTSMDGRLQITTRSARSALEGAQRLQRSRFLPDYETDEPGALRVCAPPRIPPMGGYKCQAIGIRASYEPLRPIG